MERFYFTYGTSEKMPYIGGWTEVVADNEHMARLAFRLYHPDSESGCLNCAMVYSEQEFQTTKMYQRNSNMGHGCWEVIKLTRSEI